MNDAHREARGILLRVGALLLAAAAVEAGLKLYAILAGIWFQAQLGVVAALAGVLLLVRSPGAIAPARALAALGAALVLARLLMIPVNTPPALLLMELRVQPGLAWPSLLVPLAALAVAVFATWRLGAPAVRAMQSAAGGRGWPLWPAAVLGGVIGLALALQPRLALDADAAAQAEALARRQLGDGWRYHVVVAIPDGDPMRPRLAFGMVTAWNDGEIRTLTVPADAPGL
ncbi:hypothetical protein [Coralloluteibacterium stylophorae]|uniref:Uncharacterized protein n=1 Tax=Coralloluteibacterium stylophorae TaxID=1776034 RepID=A0A8J7VS51_9GAMM|nr:hypothetical protein [Coralloluteibacterium stylophorae]MBS7457350.1 hypothetical protein [Coralloluteibacterium stylophorae]